METAVANTFQTRLVETKPERVITLKGKQRVTVDRQKPCSSKMLIGESIIPTPPDNLHLITGEDSKKGMYSFISIRI